MFRVYKNADAQGINGETVGSLYQDGALVGAGLFVFEPGEDDELELNRRGYQSIGPWYRVGSTATMYIDVEPVKTRKKGVRV